MKRHWFLILMALLVLWVGYNFVVHNDFGASLRPLYWLMEKIGVEGPR